jgi:hypothetical protein
MAVWTRAGQGYRSTFWRRSAIYPLTLETQSRVIQQNQQQLNFWHREIIQAHVNKFSDGQKQK